MNESLRTFCENYNKHHMNGSKGDNIYCHNIYHLETFDEDGNKTNEGFGVNLMTDAGLLTLAKTEIKYTNVGLYIGRGNTTPTLSDTALSNPITTTRSTHIDNNVTTYPAEFDSTTGILSQRCRVYQGYFDYNITGVTDDETVAEIAFGGSTTNIYTHALIYDESGDTPVPLVKHLNEKMVITMYFTLSYKPTQLYSALWDQHIYGGIGYATMFIYPLFGNGDNKGLYSLARIWANDNKNVFVTEQGRILFGTMFGRNSSDITVTGHTATFMTLDDNSVFFDVGKYITKLMYVNGYDTGYSFGGWDTRYMLFLEDSSSGICLSTPEAIQLPDRLTDNATTGEFNNIFIDYDYRNTTQTLNLGSATCTQMTISSIKTYNHLTKEFDDETFTQDTDWDQSNTFNPFQLRFYLKRSSGDAETVYVSFNSKAGVYSLIKFDNDVTIYATDAYWDDSTWEIITTPSSVPSTLQNKKYYLTVGTRTRLEPIYDHTPHKITTTDTSFTIPDQYYSNSGQCKDIFVIQQKNCFIIGNMLIYPDDENGGANPTAHKLYGNGNTNSNSNGFGVYWVDENGDNLVVLCNNNSIRNELYRLYTISDDGSAPTYVDFQLPFSSYPTSAPNSYTRRTYTNKGYLVASKPALNEVAIADLTDPSNITFTQLTGSYSVALNLTTYVAYIDTNVETDIRMVIYDMSTNTEVQYVDLPTDRDYVVEGLFGWGNFVYIEVTHNSNQHSTFLYSVDSETLTFLENMTVESERISPYASSDNSYPYYHPYSGRSTEECMVLTNRAPSISIANNVENCRVYIFTKDNPSSYSYLEIPDCYFYPEIFESIDKKHLLLYLQTNYYGTSYKHETFFDLGRFIDTGHYNVYLDGSNTTNLSKWGNPFMFVYKDYSCVWNDSNHTLTFSPLTFALPHDIEGTTTTIQTINDPKSLKTNRPFSLTITNDTSQWTN